LRSCFISFLFFSSPFQIIFELHASLLPSFCTSLHVVYFYCIRRLSFLFFNASSSARFAYFNVPSLGIVIHLSDLLRSCYFSDKLKVAMVQMLVGSDKQANLTHAAEMVRKAAKNGAQLVVLPVCVVFGSLPRSVPHPRYRLCSL
jgi:hypothetical protein